MAIRARPGRTIEPHPDAPKFEWAHDGVAFLWLVALILAFVITASLLAYGQA